MPSYHIVTPAKLNLGLKVIGKRPNGYHDLETVMVPIDLADHLTIQECRGNGQIDIHCPESSIPRDERNLAYRAARSFNERVGAGSDLSITIHKKIPTAAGLGGGSSDAASVLLTLNRLRSYPLGPAELHRIASSLGADVPFFLSNIPALATGIGDILKPVRSWPKLWYVIVKPPIEISTAWVYENLKLELTNSGYKSIYNLLDLNPISIVDYLENDLETVTSAHFPIIEKIKQNLREIGAKGAIMSGSGPSVFGVFSSKMDALTAKRYMLTQNFGDVFLATDWVRGAEIMAEGAD